MPDQENDYFNLSDEELDNAIAELENEDENNDDSAAGSADDSDDESTDQGSDDSFAADDFEGSEDSADEEGGEVPLVKKLRGTIRGFERKTRDLEREIYLMKQEQASRRQEGRENGHDEQPLSEEELRDLAYENPKAFIEHMTKAARESAKKEFESLNESTARRQAVEHNETIRNSFEDKHPELGLDEVEQIAQFAVQRFMPDRNGRYDDNVLEDALFLMNREGVMKKAGRDAKVKLLQQIEKGKPRATIVSTSGKAADKGVDVKHVKGMSQDDARKYASKLSDEELDALLEKL